MLQSLPFPIFEKVCGADQAKLNFPSSKEKVTKNEYHGQLLALQIINKLLHCTFFAMGLEWEAESRDDCRYAPFNGAEGGFDAFPFVSSAPIGFLCIFGMEGMVGLAEEVG